VGGRPSGGEEQGGGERAHGVKFEATEGRDDSQAVDAPGDSR
jgi:hypothetical protein